MKASPRLIIAIVSTALEEMGVALIVLLALPRAGIHVPVNALVGILATWTAIAALVYYVGSTALRKKPTRGLPSMVGCTGKATTPLAPEGRVKLHGELWAARALDEHINAGEEIIAVGEDGLRLFVRRKTPSTLKCEPWR